MHPHLNLLEERDVGGTWSFAKASLRNVTNVTEGVETGGEGGQNLSPAAKSNWEIKRKHMDGKFTAQEGGVSARLGLSRGCRAGAELLGWGGGGEGGGVLGCPKPRSDFSTQLPQISSAQLGGRADAGGRDLTALRE